MIKKTGIFYENDYFRHVADKPTGAQSQTRRRGPARGARPHVADKPTGARALVPQTVKGRIVACVIVIAIAAIVIFDLSVARESIASENYYSDPVKEYAADLVDEIADKAIQITPDSSNAAINNLRERLTGRSRWANTVIDAEQYWGLDTSTTYLILSIIEVESGGDEFVDAIGNIMQVSSVTDNYAYIANGVPEEGVAACTPAASIYAGTKIVQEALACFQDEFGVAANLDNHPQAALVAQGYNYGYAGWISYCAQNGVSEWSYWHAANYQNTVMQGNGSCVYGQKIIERLDELGTQQ